MVFGYLYGCFNCGAAAIFTARRLNGTNGKICDERFFSVCNGVANIAPQLSALFQQQSQAEPDDRLSSTVDEQLQSAAQQSIRSLVTAELSKLQINCKNVSVIMDIDETSSIVINKVIVVLASGEEAHIIRAQEHLSSVLGLQTEVTVDGGEENG